MNAPIPPGRLLEVSLEDKYTLEHGRVFMTGTHALVRLPMLQRRRDLRAGRNTAGYISGYRGSPLGNYDQALERARTHLEAHHIRFQPAVNEELAATALWGTQQVNLFEGARYDGVFGIWYGKGPGVDRSGDALRHANAFGTSALGGVLALAGDDQGAKSSTQSAQSDFIFTAVGIPIIAPSSVQELLDLSLHGFAMSRYSGCWTGIKCVTDVVESAASVEIDPEGVQIVLPEDFLPPAGGLSIRAEFAGFVEQEKRLYNQKLYAALAYARANRLNRLIWPTPQARLGIVAVGKAYNDVRQALDDLGLDEAAARQVGLRLFKVSMPWPLEPSGIAEFARGLEEILVVEEKRQLVELQLKEQLYNLPDGHRPRIVGKFEGQGAWDAGKGAVLLPSAGELSPGIVLRAIARRLRHFHSSEHIDAVLARLEQQDQAGANPLDIARIPYFCAGCPHNTSTRVPDGSRALAGIGCHYMAQWMDRNTVTFSQMGGEGAAWLGQAPFCDTPHVFANIGDGTYFHSGILAIRAAVAAGAPMTYKILVNDAVAMTGGQAIDGPFSVPQLTRQVAAEGVAQIAVVTDEPGKYGRDAGFAPGVSIHHRDELDQVQRMLREVRATTALIYDQTCAAEKRRRRKRGTFPDPDRRLFINEAVCEGCGDCGVQSNCVAIEPVETAWGRKRQINQSSCNKDFSCLKGFCPSFVSVEGARLRKASGLGPEREPVTDLPEPQRQATEAPYNILVTGIGGTGVVTVGQVIGMAAHLEGKGVTVLDITGMSQKNGAVISFVRLADTPEQLHAARIAEGAADAVIGCDEVTTLGAEALSKMHQGRTRVALNTSQTPTADFTRDPDWAYPGQRMTSELVRRVGADCAWPVDAQRLATALLGDAIATNIFMLGFAWQKGLVPLSLESVERAIGLNGVSVKLNLRAFHWGRYAAHAPEQVERALHPGAAGPAVQAPPDPVSLEELIEHRARHLTAYQNRRYADRYRGLLARVQAAEAGVTQSRALSHAVARCYAKLMAYKDEYEVARLYADPAFGERLDRLFEPGFRLRFHLAPPLLNRPDPVSGRPRKSTYGPWMMPLFAVLARCRGLRGTPFDPFGRSAERRAERALIPEYEACVETLLAGLTRDNHALAVQIAALPDEIRGFGPVKERRIEAVHARWSALMNAFRGEAPIAHAA
jgi:indolepyruvate ferredoxin oxidoreductase